MNYLLKYIRLINKLTADLDDDLDLDDDPFPLPRVGAHPHTHPCSHPRSSTCSRRNTPPQHNTLVFHRKGSITSTNSPSVNLPSSPPEFSSEPIFFRTRSQRGKSRANVHRSSENFINSLQPVSLWNREQELGDSSPNPHQPLRLQESPSHLGRVGRPLQLARVAPPPPISSPHH